MQSNWRYLQQNLGAHVIHQYKTSADYATTCRFLTSLAFIPAQHVTTAFDDVADYYEEHNPELLPFLEYFEATYIGLPNRRGQPGRPVPRFPINFWNMFERTQAGIARTNNIVEGWHSGLEATMGFHNPSIWKFMDAMRMKFAYQDRVMLQVIAGQGVIRTRPIWRQLDRRLQTICGRFQPHMNIIDYLKSIAYNFTF